MAGLVTMVLVNVHMATQAQLADLVSPLFKEHTYLIFFFSQDGDRYNVFCIMLYY